MSTITTDEAERLAQYASAGIASIGTRDPDQYLSGMSVLDGITIAAALRSLSAERDALRVERDENESAFKVWRRRCTEAEAQRDALAAECARLREALEDQIEQHRATWIAARADVEGAELAAALFEREPATVRARAALGARAS